jgi:hypothetical protein
MKARLPSLCLLIAALSVLPARAQTATSAPADKSSQMGTGKPDTQEKTAKKAEKEIAKVSGSGDIGSLGAEAPAATPGVDRFALEIIKRFDKDGDGKLDASELAEFLRSRAGQGPNAQGGPMRAIIMKLFDKNGDGVLDAEERAAAEKFREEQIKRFDKNGDGKLDDTERAEAMKALLAEHPELATVGR